MTPDLKLEWAKVLSHKAESLAWPVVVLLVFLMLRARLVALIDRTELTAISLPFGKAEFGGRVDRLTAVREVEDGGRIADLTTSR